MGIIRDGTGMGQINMFHGQPWRYSKSFRKCWIKQRRNLVAGADPASKFKGRFR